MELEAENAKRREDNDRLIQAIEDLHNVSLEDELVQLENENAKLRELVWDMWQFTGTACKKYPRLFDPSAQGGQMVQLNALDCFEQRMSELGIEDGE
jgi:hypothetical protein